MKSLWPSWLHLPTARRTRLMALALLLVCLALPGLALAATFSDVPPGHWAYAPIEAVYAARITVGCGVAGKFCPDQAVTRGQMAASMHRGFGRIAYTAGSNFELGTINTWQDAAALTIEAGEVTGGTGFIKLDGQISVWNTWANGCPCELQFRIVDATSGGASIVFYETVLNNVNGVFGNAAAGVTWAKGVPTGQTHTFKLQVLQSNGVPNILRTQGALTAIYAPFGSTGGSTLAAPGAAPEAPTSSRQP